MHYKHDLVHMNTWHNVALAIYIDLKIYNYFLKLCAKDKRINKINSDMIGRNEYLYTKGQIVSECLLDVFEFSKKTTKNLTNFCPRI